MSDRGEMPASGPLDALGPEDARALREGARNAVRVCMGTQPSDHVFVLTDEATLPIGEALASEVRAVGASVVVRKLEEYGERPITAFPERLRADLVAARPTVTLYAAAARPGEIAFRIELLPFLVRQLRVRHGHMPGVQPQLVIDGLRADYHRVAAVTQRVTERVRPAREILVTSPAGTDLVARFSPDLRWNPCPGLYHQPGTWGNLPEGETFTSPARVDGTLAASVLGDHFSERYGVLAAPVIFTIVDSRVVEARCARQEIADDVYGYLLSAENGNRVGEFAIGTNVGLTGLVGNLLQDEKLPGVHIAFGNPYPDETGADWRSRVHVDVIPVACTIVVDGETIMRTGVFEPAYRAT
ncbi:MAG: aminopeptidase [Chloroflexi bacterium]|nr:aminopeptidase [Chloroflexota bacterium]